MTWKQAFLRCCVAGAVDDATIAGLSSQPWWDDECDDVAAGCYALRHLGQRVGALGLAKALVAIDYSFDDAAELATDAMGRMGADEVTHYAQCLRDLAEVAA
jgi:hypothetical protein